MDTLIESLQNEWTSLVALTPRLIVAAIVFLLFYAGGKAGGHGLGRLLRRTRTVKRHERLAERFVVFVVSLLGITAALHVLGLTALATSLLATGGMVAVVLGFAFREIGENFLAGIFLAFDRSFDVGDLIQSGGLTGTVKAIELRSVHIRTNDGCDIFIPSGEIFKNALFNYTRDGLRRGDFIVGIDYGDNPAAARAQLLECVQESEFVLSTPSPAVEVSGFAAQYVELAVYFWTDTFTADVDLPRLRTTIMERCHRALREEGFTFSSTAAVALNPVDVRLAKTT